MLRATRTIALLMVAPTGACAADRKDEAKAASNDSHAWRSLPLVTGGKIDRAWKHPGFGGFVVEDGTLRTNCDARGLGLLVYTKEKFGDCQLRVVYRAKEQRSNSG